MTKRSRKTQSRKDCFLVVFLVSEYHEDDENYDDHIDENKQVFVSASSYDEAIELAERHLESIGFAYDENLDRWTDFVYCVNVGEVYSVHEEKFWDSDNLSRVSDWSSLLSKWAQANPDEATRLWQLANDGTSSTHEKVAKVEPLRAIAEANLLNSISQASTTKPGKKSKSI